MKTCTAALLAVLTQVPNAPAGNPDDAIQSPGPQSFRYRSNRGDPEAREETGRILHSAVWSGQEVLVWGGGADDMFHQSGWRIDPATGKRRPMSEQDAPSGRWGHAGVWTGSRMIIWGGRNQFPTNGHRNDGAAYDPESDTWKPLSCTGAPEARSQMAAVWTGTEMIVWGGFGDDAKAWSNGGRYLPGTDHWAPLPEAGAPEARVEPLVVWTGSEMIIWGGITPDLRRTLASGARYNPSTNQWSPVQSNGAPCGTWGHGAVWTGHEMLLWGGARQDGTENENKVTREGAAYNPVTNTWRPLPLEGAPCPRFFHSTVWTGSSMIVWGGGDQKDCRNFNDGAEYVPAENRWKPLTWQGVAPARGMHTATWTPQGMVVFGGSTGGSNAFSGPLILASRQ